MTKVCDQCGAGLVRRPREALRHFSKRKFCCVKCSLQHAETMRTSKGAAWPVHHCLKCGKEIPKAGHPTWDNYRRKKYCSNTCRPSFKENVEMLQKIEAGRTAVFDDDEHKAWIASVKAAEKRRADILKRKP